MKENQKSNQKLNSKLIFGSVLILMTIIFIVGCWCITSPHDTDYQLKPNYSLITKSDNYESFDVSFDLTNNNLSITLNDYEHIYTLLSKNYDRVDNHIDGYIYSYYIDEAYYTTPYPFTCEIEILDNSRIKFRLGYDYLILKAI